MSQYVFPCVSFGLCCVDSFSSCFMFPASSSLFASGDQNKKKGGRGGGNGEKGKKSGKGKKSHRQLGQHVSRDFAVVPHPLLFLEAMSTSTSFSRVLDKSLFLSEVGGWRLCPGILSLQINFFLLHALSTRAYCGVVVFPPVLKSIWESACTYALFALLPTYSNDIDQSGLATVLQSD